MDILRKHFCGLVSEGFSGIGAQDPHYYSCLQRPDWLCWTPKYWKKPATPDLITESPR